MAVLNFILSVFGLLATIMLIASVVLTPIFLIVWLASQTPGNKAKYKKLCFISLVLAPIGVGVIVLNLIVFALLNTVMSAELGSEDFSTVIEIKELESSSLIQ